MMDSGNHANPKHLPIFNVEWSPETPIKDAIKFSLISLAAVSLTVLSLCAFLEVSR